VKQCLVAKITTLLQAAPLVRNLARKKFIARFVLGLFKSRNVQFCEVAQHLNDGAKLASNETRIQDFFREVDLDYLALAVLLVGLVPGTGKLRLCLDRTEWDFGQPGKRVARHGGPRRLPLAAVLGIARQPQR
jgi:hypothetical protein